MPLMPVTSKPVASPTTGIVLPPAPGGMNVAVPANEIDDTEAVYLQDILLDQPGLARRRGPITAVPGLAALPRPGSGVAMTLDPQGGTRFGVFTGDNTHGYFTIYNAALNVATDITWPNNLPTAPGSGHPYQIIDANAALNNGTMLGQASAYDANNPSEALAYWAGGTGANYATGTITTTANSATVVGSGTTWTTNIQPGMWLFVNTTAPYANFLLGMVQSVTDNTHIVLSAPVPVAFAGVAYTAQSLRGINPKVGKGTLTGAAASTTLAGGNTKFLKQGLNSGTWILLRASDLNYIGTVTSVQSDTALTLTGGSAIAVADNAYVAVQVNGDYGLPLLTSKPGFLTAVYAGRQWYANSGKSFTTPYRLWFSDPSDPEMLDMSTDGDWLPINSSGDVQEPIVGLGSAYNSLVVLKESETFAVFGTDPTSFDVTKIADDGTLSGMSVQQFGAGVIWAGRQGIHFYDGTQDNNLTLPKFGTSWRQMVETFDPTTYRMWSMIERNHYILHIESITPPFGVTKGNTTTLPTHWVVVVNLDSNAVTLWQNVKFRGAISLPASQGHESWFVYNDGSKAVVAEASAFFDQAGNDPVVEGVSNVGPDFYMVSKRLDGGMPTRLKRFTYFILNYLAKGDSVNIDTVLGLNNVGSTASTNFPATVPTWSQIGNLVSNWTALKTQYAHWADIVSSWFLPDRLRFLKKSQFLEFRLWQNSSNVTDVKVGNFEIGYKPMRPGRI